MDQQREPFITTNEAARHLGKGRAWLYDNLERLTIPHARVGRQLRFRLSEIDRWVLDQTESHG